MTINSLNPAEKIYDELINKEISKIDATQILISLIEGSNNDKIRMHSVDILGKISSKPKKIFKFLENLSISDENPLIRAKAATVIIEKYLKESYLALEWIIEHDPSKLVMKTLIELFKKIKIPIILTLDEKLKEKLSSVYGVVSDEAEFLLDLELEVDFFNIEYLKMYSTCSETGVISGNYMMCAIKNGRIEALNLSNWGLKRLPESIGALAKLKYLNLQNNEIETLPDTIGLLHRLRVCDLSGCKIHCFPNSIIQLKKLQKLSLRHNYTLNNIPKPILFIARNYLKKKYIWEGVKPNEADVLALLEILSGTKLEKVSINDLIIYKRNACHYKINEQGNIIGIYVFNSHFSYLTTFPKHICVLAHLKELEFPNNDIRIIPNSIEKLRNLQRLNLRNNMIEIVPEELGSLKNLNCLKLSGNRIKTIPGSIKYKLDRFESSKDLNGFKRYFFGIPISEILRKYQ